METPITQRAHVERARRVVDHVEQIVRVLAATNDGTATSDAVDDLARQFLSRQWHVLSDATSGRTPAAALDHIVRPAVTEFVLLRYLSQLPRHDAIALVSTGALAATVDAPAAESAQAGPIHTDGPSMDERTALDVLADLGHRYGWALEPTHRLGRTALPTIRWMAAAVGELHMYDALDTDPVDPGARRGSVVAFQLAWASIVLCRTVTAVRQLMRSTDQLPSPEGLLGLMAECAATAPSVVATAPSAARRGPAVRQRRTASTTTPSRLAC